MTGKMIKKCVFGVVAFAIILSLSACSSSFEPSQTFPEGGAKDLAPQLMQVCASTVKATGEIPAAGSILVV